MADHPYINRVLLVAGQITGLFAQVGSKLLKTVKPYVRAVLIGGLIVVTLPSIAEYWLRRTRIPDVPVSAIVLLLVSSFFLLAFAAAIYAVCSCLLQIQMTERSNGVMIARRRRQYEETEGSFNTANDEEAWQREQIDMLKRQGIQTDGIDLLRRNGVLTEDDQNAIKEMAEASAMRNRGRTG